MDATRERAYEEEFRIGDAAVKRVEVSLSAPSVSRDVLRQAERELAKRKRRAESGDVEAMHQLGRMYLGVAKDDTEALKWFRKAAAQGWAPSMNNLGVMYALGAGVPKDDVEAVSWYRKAAEKDFPMAMYSLGAMFDRDEGVAKDDAEAVNWYRKGAEKENFRAMNNLAFMLRTGRGVAKDAAEGLNWYRQAAEKGNELSMFNLGNIYATGSGVPKAEAVKCFRKAAQKGCAPAVAELTKRGWK